MYLSPQSMDLQSCAPNIDIKIQHILLYDQDRVDFAVSRRRHGWDLDTTLYCLMSLLEVGRMRRLFQGEEFPSGLAQYGGGTGPGIASV